MESIPDWSADRDTTPGATGATRISKAEPKSTESTGCPAAFVSVNRPVPPHAVTNPPPATARVLPQHDENVVFASDTDRTIEAVRFIVSMWSSSTRGTRKPSLPLSNTVMCPLERRRASC